MHTLFSMTSVSIHSTLKLMNSKKSTLTLQPGSGRPRLLFFFSTTITFLLFLCELTLSDPRSFEKLVAS